MSALGSQFQPQEEVRSRNRSATSPILPEIPGSDLGLAMEFEWTLNAIMPASDPATAKVHKRASNVLKLAQENEKLRAELKGMTDRLEAAERKRQEMARIQEEQDQRDREEEAMRQALEEQASIEQEDAAPTQDEQESGGPEGVLREPTVEDVPS